MKLPFPTPEHLGISIPQYVNSLAVLDNAALEETIEEASEIAADAASHYEDAELQLMLAQREAASRRRKPAEATGRKP